MPSSDQQHQTFLQECLQLACQQAETPGGGPFAALVVKDRQILATGCNQVTGNCDPTAHAEVVAIRRACALLQDFQLHDCVIYSSCEPCPMCLGAIFWARPKAVYFAATRDEAAAAGFDDSLIYRQITLTGSQRSIPFIHLNMPSANKPFDAWRLATSRIPY